MPKAKIDGTQIPMKIAAFSSPLKYNISEKIRELKAEINNNMSVIVNFFITSLNISKLYFEK
jgi:hypothetical protein